MQFYKDISGNRVNSKILSNGSVWEDLRQNPMESWGLQHGRPTIRLLTWESIVLTHFREGLDYYILKYLSPSEGELP